MSNTPVERGALPGLALSGIHTSLKKMCSKEKKSSQLNWLAPRSCYANLSSRIRLGGEKYHDISVQDPQA